MFDDVDYKKARANLILISLAVSVYILGEGQFSKGSFFGGTIDFGKPIVLSIAASIIFIFICWRFLLSAGDALKEFTWDIWTLIYSHNIYLDICKQWVADVNRVRDVDASEDDIKISETNEINFTGKSIFCPKDNNTVHAYYPPRICGGIFPKKLAYGAQDKVTRYPTHEKTLMDFPKNAFPFKCDADIIKKNLKTTDRFKLLYLELTSIFKAIFLRRAFSDVIFPFLFGYCALIIFIHHIANKYSESVINWLLF